MSAKKILNDAGSVVVDSLHGVVASAAHLRLLEGLPELKVVVNSGHDKRHVAVISGTPARRARMPRSQHGPLPIGQAALCPAGGLSYTQ
jgi:hypothetical protein